MIFPKYYTDQLTEIFLKKENGKQSPTSHNNENTLNEKFDGETLSNNGDIDSEPMDNVDGEPIEDVDGEPIEDVDGEPIEDVDGEPIEENFDSEPMGENEEDFTDVKDMFS
jgi:U2-associated protein SR140